MLRNHDEDPDQGKVIILRGVSRKKGAMGFEKDFELDGWILNPVSQPSDTSMIASVTGNYVKTKVDLATQFARSKTTVLGMTLGTVTRCENYTWG